MKRIYNRLSNVEIIALGFAIIIMCGTILLMLPISSRQQTITPFLDALFTATSACCVTGLVVRDTASYWSVFGQCIILLLIQIGGLGFMTIGIFFATFLKKKISLRQRGLIEESMNTLHLAGGVRLVKCIIKGTLFFEGLGTVLLSIPFVKDFGLVKGIYYGLFHSISAFCNAGFDLLGIIEPYGSLVPYVDQPLINITIMALIVIGGLGFIVWEDLLAKKWHFHQYLLQTKIVLFTTFVLIFGGALLFYLLENNHVLSNLSQNDKIMASFFQSITTRTAGFNTIDTSHMTHATQILMMFLMFIGGSPGSTAGGIKTTTFLVIFIFIYTTVTNKNEYNIFNRRFEMQTIKKACAVMLIHLSLIIIGTFMICALQPDTAFQDILFEVFSAIGTVGISTGITRNLIPFSRMIIIILMYSGRLGTLTFALTLTQHKKVSQCINPAEKVAIG